MNRQTKVWGVVTLVVDIVVDLIPIMIAFVLIIRYKTATKTSTDDLLTAILGVLAAIALGGLWDRLKRLRRIQELVTHSHLLLEKHLAHRLRADEFFVGSTPENDFYANAKSIAISGITLGNTASEFRHVLRQCLAAGAYIRVIVVDPGSNALEQLVLRSWGTTTIEYYKNRLNNTIELIKLFREVPNATGRVEIGLLPYVPSFGIQMIDPSSLNGAAYIEIYHHSSDSPSPKFKLSAKDDPSWLSFFSEQFELMWAKCTVNQIVSGSSVSVTR
jgi:hypothetical protein